MNRFDLQNKELTTLPDDIPLDITELDISYNNLTELDVAKFKKLNILNCNRNKINKIIINTKLSILNCDNNYLQQLNLSDSHLSELDCSDNELTELKFPSTLSKLICNNNQLTQLDIIPEDCFSTIDTTEYLNITHNNLTESSLKNLSDFYKIYQQLILRQQLQQQLPNLISNSNIRMQNIHQEDLIRNTQLLQQLELNDEKTRDKRMLPEHKDEKKGDEKHDSKEVEDIYDLSYLNQLTGYSSKNCKNTENFFGDELNFKNGGIVIINKFDNKYISYCFEYTEMIKLLKPLTLEYYKSKIKIPYLNYEIDESGYYRLFIFNTLVIVKKPNSGYTLQPINSQTFIKAEKIPDVFTGILTIKDLWLKNGREEDNKITGYTFDDNKVEIQNNNITLWKKLNNSRTIKLVL